MFEMKVAPFDEARSLLMGGWPTHCVSLIDPDATPPPSAPSHLVLVVEDVGLDSRKVAIVPSARHVQDLLAFTSRLQDGDRLLIHCHGGFGRSPAAAMAALVQHGLPATEALDRVRALRPWMMPNLLILSLADAQLGLGGALASAGGRFRDEASSRSAGDRLILPTT